TRDPGRTPERPPPQGRPLRRDSGSAEVAAPVVVIVQRHGLAGRGAERTARRPVGVVVPLQGVRRGARLLGGLDPDVAVPADAGAGRDELADDDVLLEPEQAVGP